MFEILEKIRQKPEKTRAHIAFFGALCVALVIFGIWLTVLYPDWNDSQSQQAKAVAQSPSPMSTFGSTIHDGFSSLGSKLGELKNSMTSFTSAEPSHYEATTTDTASVVPATQNTPTIPTIIQVQDESTTTSQN